MNTLMKYREVAEQLQVHQRTVSRLVQSGRLPVVKLGRNTPRIPLEALEAFLKTVQVTL